MIQPCAGHYNVIVQATEEDLCKERELRQAYLPPPPGLTEYAHTLKDEVRGESRNPVIRLP